MLSFLFNVAGTMLITAMGCNVWRLLRGPDAADRVLALDTLYINAVALLSLTGLVYGKQIFYEAAILIALLGFVGTVSLCKFLLRGDIIE